MAIDTTSPRTRRAILLGALGGVAAAAAATVGRASPVGAANGEPLYAGFSHSATNSTEIHATGNAFGLVGASGSAAGVHGFSTSGSGVLGTSHSGNGVSGSSDLAHGVEGTSTSSVAVHGLSAAAARPAIFGWAVGNSTGIQGHSGGTAAPIAPVKTGLFGYANQDAASVGVRGQSPKGRGVVAGGGKAQLRLLPSTANSHPASGALGDLFLDKSGRLSLCKGGTTWVKLG